MNSYFNRIAITCQCFVDRIVDHLVDDMVKTYLSSGSDIHGRTLAHCVASLQNCDRCSVVSHAFLLCCFSFCCYQSCLLYTSQITQPPIVSEDSTLLLRTFPSAISYTFALEKNSSTWLRFEVVMTVRVRFSRYSRRCLILRS